MTKLYIYNSLGNQKEEFIPIDSSHVRIYACGPTVYSYAHIGNARMAVVNDLLTKIIKKIYPKVTYVSNITDIDDKIIKTSQDLNVPFKQITRKFEKIYNEDMINLGVIKPDIQPRATEYISDMIKLIQKLIKNNNAYEKDKHVLFHVPSFQKYGELSGRNREEQIIGSRVEVAPFKKDPTDFVLWKPSANNVPGWDSPWGYGRPGWHLECSAMSEKTLDIPFDIHSGGVDLIFPHHENEIAQSCAAHKNNNPKSFAKYWVHNGFVIVDGEKMSKSQGNIRLVNDLIKSYDGEVLRLTLISAHYRQPLNWTISAINQSKNILDKFYRTLKELEKIEIPDKIDIPEKVFNALCDDMNTPQALAELNKIIKNLNTASKDEKIFIKSSIIGAGNILGIFQKNPNEWLNYGRSEILDDKTVNKLINERNKARKNKDFKKADEIREKLKNKGIEIEDKENETIWRSI
ncbi:MAG: Cysteine--tRNA ligase [Alphaproteobacteria bacterium MarineAlpha5_Bin9]|nr:MAG: Cysteine--tRNA ligase [Alphaproteobacteria bacterium MarineAlpha5_Bin9]|tara:strand:- start:30692 stop:32077 length:1386 start_codon:yes stop_codon:yes gene_type:complete